MSTVTTPPMKECMPSHTHGCMEHDERDDAMSRRESGNTSAHLSQGFWCLVRFS